MHTSAWYYHYGNTPTPDFTNNHFNAVLTAETYNSELKRRTRRNSWYSQQVRQQIVDRVLPETEKHSFVNDAMRLKNSL